jgi:hypothetical protein
MKNELINYVQKKYHNFVIFTRNSKIVDKICTITDRY